MGDSSDDDFELLDSDDEEYEFEETYIKKKSNEQVEELNLIE